MVDTAASATAVLAPPRGPLTGRLERLWLPIVCALLAAGPASAADERFEYTQIKMGAPLKLVFYAPDREAANRAAEAAYGHVDELNRIFSDYDPESELSHLSQAAPTPRPVKLSQPLWQVLERSQQLAAQSEGAFDVTVGPYVRLWRRARRTHELPAADRLEQARLAVGYRHLKLDADAHTALLERPRMVLDLGGIAMGYTVDDVLGVLARHGVRRALVDASGDIGLGDPPPGKAGWTIGIAPLAPDAPPSRYVELARRAISTSGDAFQHVDIGGKRYSHIVDPRTGLGLTDSSSVTVIADNCFTADCAGHDRQRPGARERPGPGRQNAPRRGAHPADGRRRAGHVPVAGLQAV